MRTATKSTLSTTAMLIVCLASLIGGVANGGVIVNGDFSDATGTPFASWGSPPDFQLRPPIDPDGNEFATLQVGVPDPSGGLIIAGIQQTFTLPKEASHLLFEYRIEPPLTEPIGGNFFFATLADGPAFNRPPITPDQNFFQVSFGEMLGEGVSVRPLPDDAGGWREVSLDLSVLTEPLPTQATLRFILLAGSEGIDTSVSIDNVRVIEQQPVPEPWSLAVWGSTFALVLAGAWRRRGFSVPKLSLAR